MKMYREDKIFQVVAHVFMGTVTVITVLPLILLFIASFTENKDIT